MIEQITRFLSVSKNQILVLATLSCLLYGNTLMHDFTLDDAIVISDNEYVQQGVKGIGNIWSKDSFRGFFKTEGKDKLVAGGRYRPMTLFAFALVVELFGKDPFIFHLFAMICYSLLVLTFYFFLRNLLLEIDQSREQWMAFLSALIFAVHPLHTECVANVKGLDEVFALGFSLLSAILFLKSIKSGKLLFSLLSGLSLMLGLFSKENAIAYLGLIPLAAWMVRKQRISTLVFPSILLFLFSFLFLIVRGSILGWNPTGGMSWELMNNPFLKWTGSQYIPYSVNEKLGTVFYCLLRDIGLLVLPHPLTHDYYPVTITAKTITNPLVILSLVLHTAMIGYAIKKITTKPVISWSIAAYLFPLLIVSNLFFPIGTFMGERFLFMSSVGFSIAVAFGIIQIQNHKPVLVTGLALVLLLFCGKTISRNLAWKNDRTLFSTDIQNSAKSAKIHVAYAGVLLEDLIQTKDSKELQIKADKILSLASKAKEFHPTYRDAYMISGDANSMKRDFENAIKQYQHVLSMDPDYLPATANLQIAYREYGKQLGSEKNDLQNANLYLKKAIELDPKDEESYLLLGISSGFVQQYNEAIQYFNKAIEINPKNAQAYFNLFITYTNMKNQIEATKSLQKAIELDPEIKTKNGIQ